MSETEIRNIVRQEIGLVHLLSDRKPGRVSKAKALKILECTNQTLLRNKVKLGAEVINHRGDFDYDLKKVLDYKFRRKRIILNND